MLVEHVAQRLNEPGAVERVAPRVVARHGRVGDQEVGLHRYLAHALLVGVHERIGVEADGVHEVGAAARLYEEELGLAGQRFVQLKRPNQFVNAQLAIHAVDDAVLAVRHQHAQKAVLYICI